MALVVVHTPSQRIRHSIAEPEAAHAPPTHGVTHWASQPPQWRVSVVTSAQTSPHT
jgi:hypothetical protein